MNIASFGTRIEASQAEPVDFFSDRPASGFDAAFYDLEGVMEGWLKGDVHASKEYGVLSTDSFQDLLVALEQRAKEMRKLVDEGRPVVLFPSAFPALKYADKKGKWQDVPDLGAFFPASGSAVRPASGDRIDARGSPALLKFAERLAKHFRYAGVLTKPFGQPAFLAPETGQTVGAFLCDEKRWALIAPRLGTQEGWNDFPAAFRELYAATGANAQLPALPEWHEQYLIPGESDVAEVIARIEKAMDDLNALLDTNRAEKTRLGYLKRLFTDKGPSLTKAVQTALEGLGFEVVPGPRESLLAKFGQAAAIVHAVGKDSKNINDADAVELDKAVKQFIEEHDVVPKGILVANTFRDTAIDARTEPAFAASMLGYSKNRGHLLITGLQLLCLHFEARIANAPGRARLALLESVGPFPRFSGEEWKAIVSERK